MSAKPSLADAAALEGSTVSGSVFIILAGYEGIEKLEFYIDDPDSKGDPATVLTGGTSGTEGHEPPLLLDTRSIGNGQHTVTVAAALENGELLVESATFQVENLSEDDIVWNHGFENGRIEPFMTWKNGNASIELSHDVTRSGDFAAVMTISNPGGNRSPGARLAVPVLEDGSPLPEDAFYSSWFYIPQSMETPHNIIFQWKNRNPDTGSSAITYGISIRNRPATGAMHLAITRHIGDDGDLRGNGWGLMADAPVDLPAGEWFHLECRYRWSLERGRVQCWQDGQELWDLRDVPTRYDFEESANNWTFQWTLANYSPQTIPATQSIYVDDAVLSSEKVGPGLLAQN